MGASYPRRFWERSWQSLERAARSLSRPEAKTDEKTRRVLAIALHDIFNKTQDYFDMVDMKRLLLLFFFFNFENRGKKKKETAGKE